MPSDPLLRFLACVLDDFSDEWFYRHAVGTRWLYEENRTSGSWDIAREGSLELPVPWVAEATTAGSATVTFDDSEKLIDWRRAAIRHAYMSR